MKTSSKILLTTGLIIVIILLASVIGSRIFLNKYSNSYKSGDLNYTVIEKDYKDIIDFTSLDITGDWDITINFGTTAEAVNSMEVQKRRSILQVFPV